MTRGYDACPTCGERAQVVPFEGGKVYSFPCTAEIVVTSNGDHTVIKRCPDIDRKSDEPTRVSRFNP